MGEIAPAEHPVPVGVVALAAPEVPPGLQELRVARATGESVVNRAGEPQHGPVEVVHLRILHKKVPPEAAAEEGPELLPVGQRLDPVLGFIELAAGVGGERHSPISR